ncbi:5102_t:CDS:2 [Funneliformis caledonium]|uniref:5102_t:CDS:1 n=1 Tax=Funneliformis caledonium TaxID=1117310 RepID=A0A9N9GKN0_9GLOM|nr:5102_t:CDS:2 [Funneliformis caledonium]
MLRHVAQKYTQQYVPIRSLVQNTNGTESLQFIKGTEDNQLLKLGGLMLTAIIMTGGGAI